MPALKISGSAATVLAATMLLLAAPLDAQERLGCERTEASDPPARQIFKCGTAISFEREPNASLRITQRPDNPAPRVIEVDGGAILIEVDPGSAPTQIRTPHAIATVRGTTYVVDAGADQSSIFVVEGTVTVRRSDSASTVTLQAGDGVDVALDTPLVVRSWGAGRVAALLARFGR